MLQWGIQPSEFWKMTLHEFWLLLEYKTSEGNPKIKVKKLTKSRLKEMIAADEERQRRKA